jgi:hypothetical protein
LKLTIDEIKMNEYDPTNGAPYGFTMYWLALIIKDKWFQCGFKTIKERDEFINENNLRSLICDV